MGRRHPDGIPGEPQEVHSWNQNDLRRHQEEGRAPGPGGVPEVGDIMNKSLKAEYLMSFCCPCFGHYILNLWFYV